jgi:hypothetical protein
MNRSMNLPPNNKAWNLESFLDSLIFELDKARDTLAIKGVNKPMTYAVKDLSLDLQLFPEFDGNQVRFTTAKPGETGASKISIALGSITDRQIRETTRVSASQDDLRIDEVEELEPEMKESLKKIGVSSVADIENLEARNIDLAKVAPGGTANAGISDLATRLKALRNKKQVQRQMSLSQSERQAQPPRVTGARFLREGASLLLTLQGENFLADPGFSPFATLNEVPAEVVTREANLLRLRIPGHAFRPEGNALKVALDNFAIIQMHLQ